MSGRQKNTDRTAREFPPVSMDDPAWMVVIMDRATSNVESILAFLCGEAVPRCLARIGRPPLGLGE